MYKIAVLVSGSGSDLQSIIDAVESSYVNCSIKAVISDKPDVYALERAKSKGIETYVFDRKVYGKNISEEILKVTEGKVDLIVLAGFLSILSEKLIKIFSNKIINIHPSLIPSFCGNGMYGLKVHQAAIDYGVKFSGCTVHFVDEGTDTGAIILQQVVPVLENDTAETLQKRVLEEEHKILPKAVKLLAEGSVKIDGRKVYIGGV
ncbi:MAG: phosphoribosylglycinamide formyltransferase [Bacillota bacterium]|nr:phosphoribosylglycinamide formyltransferase [Bacillota bacterium]